MSYDGIMTRAVTRELQTLVGGRVNKIYQPFKTELVLTVRAKGTNHPLLLSANATFARAHLTSEKYQNPAEPPMFCMLLRKHLEGGFVHSIEQSDMDRIITVRVRNKDELGDTTEKQLIIEIMGRHSNIILMDSKTGVVIDSIKHVRFDQSSYRTVGPGQPYKRPPEQHKRDLLTATKEDVLRAVDFNAGKLDRQLVATFSGLSPLVASEVVHRAGMANKDTLPEAFLEVARQVAEHQYTPELVLGKKEFFSVIHLSYKDGERHTYETPSPMLDRFYYGKAERDRVKQQAFDLERLLKSEYQKNKRKRKKLEATLSSADEAGAYQKLGELLTAHMHLVGRGDESVEVYDYYEEEGGTLTIKLDPQKTAAENAQAYFKQYQKAKTARVEVQRQLEKTEVELQYLESLLQQMESASSRDIEGIREELVEEGYIRRRQQTGKKKKKQPDKPQLEAYTSSTGTSFLVGKNNRQNEYVTNRLARQDEIWLHTKDIPGSHVVIRDTNPDETTLAEAALVAAYFSKARQSQSVPVDYTKIRHVKKPNGAKPGYVTYDQQTTLFVTPKEDTVLALRAQK
ncbi:Rqc2 family fibronectin-binding protein [Shouchella shacheensis]|uniref:Rqc2 family fibronectin-binding protein n=1 Tax=Shouchella shacheensis TaxID=1649580 RepID=UPI000B20DE0D|nr:NFACT RNA binding domain-containing protein [Shouchella shacheensis]